MVHFDTDQTDLEAVEEQSDVDFAQLTKAEEVQGKLEFNAVDEKLMHSVLENDKQKIDEGKLIEDALNQGMGAFTPDMMFEQLVKNYKMAKKMFGESLIRRVSGYSPEYLEKNKGIPEFQRELKKRIQAKTDQLKKSDN